MKVGEEMRETRSNAPDPRALLCSVEEAAAILGISRTAVFQLLKENRLRSVKIQKRRLVPLSALDQFVHDLLEAS